MILAAGLGTRLKPWTLEHPKALVPVDGVPMLERIMCHLEDCGFDCIVVNIHHFSDQIIDYLNCRDSRASLKISDETSLLLDTGGGILNADSLFDGDYPVLVHNVDILSNADLKELIAFHQKAGNDVTLLTSPRESSRKLIFDKNGKLKGWLNSVSGERKPSSLSISPADSEEAFSGIYVLGKRGMEALRRYAAGIDAAAFPIMDFFLSFPEGIEIGHYFSPELRLLDIGKPAALQQASEFLKSL